MEKSNPHTAEVAPRAEAATKTSEQGGQSLPSGAERRRQVRYVVSATALVIESTSRTRLTGRASDLGLAGCYVDLMSPFPVGSSVLLRLTDEGHSFECEARVAYAMPGMGMGLAFTKAAKEQVAVLREWVGALRRGTGAASKAPPAPAPEHGFDREQSAAASKADASLDALHELVALLLRKGVLDESEAASLRRKLTR